MHLSGNPVLLLLSQVGLILLASRVMGWLFARFKQPQVMGEMVAGIILGPSLFGLLAPAAHAAIFPAASVPMLNVLSQIGVIFFLFLIGLELDPKLLRNRGHAALVISHVSIIAPFLLGAGLTLYLYGNVFNDAPQMRFSSVALFMGAAMSITAFPVLARILTERGLHKTNLGAVAITCAAIDDVTAWCMLAFVVGIARAEGVAPAILTASLSAVYVLSMFFVIRPFLSKLLDRYDREQRVSQNVVALILLLTLASAWVTEAIGIHALFGAFLMGAIMPKGSQFVRALSEKLEDYTVVFLLPIFFAYTGLKTQIGLLNSPALIVDTALIILVACIGKFGGSALAARATGMPWRESAAIGTLMNTRGLMELVILNIGRELGVITPAVFAMMVLMALVTTFLTTPALQLIYPRRLYASLPLVGRRRGFGVLIPVADPKSGGPLLQLAHSISGPHVESENGDDPAGGSIYALHLSRPTASDAYRAGAGETFSTSTPDPTLRLLMDHADRHHIRVEPIAFSSRDVAADVARVARERHADLVLIGFHKPVFGKTILGGVVHRVLTGVDADVGVFVDRGFLGARRVLIPFMDDAHDRLALRLAHRIGRNQEAEVTVLHVVPPSSPEAGGAREAVRRVFEDPAQPLPVEFTVVEDASPVEAVLREARRGYDLVIIGVSDEWGLESHLFGFRPERIAEKVDCSLLIVRQHAAGAGAASASDASDALAPPTLAPPPTA
jgi:Kef-type K+ transport system membrane component KefB/nucleotide-binding universal stress UspA family protein